MQTGTRVTPAAGRDRVVTAAMMAARLGFVVAVALGVGGMAGLVEFAGVKSVHILAGVLTLLGILVAGLRALSLGRGAALALVGLVGGMGGAAVALSGLGGIFHLALMVASIGMAEANMAKLKRS
ncbi:MAG TPA: hypothetical protein VNT75_31715 [Symbiobacteriaceae bacterium]|nr:hypothetical protein [Symbiobacteriaceae bacterium]